MRTVNGVTVIGSIEDSSYREVLTPGALKFLGRLHREFDQRRLALLEDRVTRQAELDAGALPDFLHKTTWIRESKDWQGPSIPADLQDRRVEITGPVSRKMVINALNSDAKVFMADFEDSNAPTWKNYVEGQINLRDAINKTITYTNQKTGKFYKLERSRCPVLMVRPRGWHLNEAHILVDGEEMSGALADFGLYFYTNANNLINNGSGPYFYLAKLENHREARLWNDVFVFSQSYCKIAQGTVRATVLIETILAVFEMEEILYELRDHSAGLNGGRWDYIFSFIKKMRNHPNVLLPDRDQIGMNKPWMKNYTHLLIKTCHKRGVHAMGGMAAQIPVKNNPQVNAQANEKVRQDKLREVLLGCDGTWVAHPGLLPIALGVFNEHMKTPNQINKPLEANVQQADLLDLGDKGTISPKGLYTNISVGLSYLESWIMGNGCLPMHNKMEDAATAEISRCQIWQWLKHKAVLENGKTVTRQLVSNELDKEMARLQSVLGDKWSTRRFDLAEALWRRMLLSDTLDDFMTTIAYPYVIKTHLQSSI